MSLKKRKDKIWSWAPKGSPIPGRTGRLTVGRKINSTQLNSRNSYKILVELKDCTPLWTKYGLGCGCDCGPGEGQLVCFCELNSGSLSSVKGREFVNILAHKASASFRRPE
jgi:hypothetical protein